MRFLIFGVILIAAGDAYSQSITKDSVEKMTRISPSFTSFRDNYFITGTSLQEKPDKYNSDIKYQISIKQRLTRTVLPFKTYLFITYTQKAFWDVYRASSPFADINFNPAIGVGKRVYNKKDLAGYLMVMYEHESNGKDSTLSRSRNFVSVTYTYYSIPKMVITVKGWIPVSYGDQNQDLAKYIGYGELQATYNIVPRKLILDVVVRKGASWSTKGSCQAQLYFKPFKNSNQYLMMQWFQGYAENLMNYTQHTSMLRLGIVIKPDVFNVY